MIVSVIGVVCLLVSVSLLALVSLFRPLGGQTAAQYFTSRGEYFTSRGEYFTPAW